MNKKGEAVTGIILLFLLIGGLIFAENKLEKERELYIGDTSTKALYNFNSKNPFCNIEEIKIDKVNVTIFENKDVAMAQGFNLSEKCD